MIRGRWFVRVIAAALVSYSAWSILLYVAELGPHRLPGQIIRFGLTVWLAYGLLHAWDGARWLAVASCVVAIAGAGIALYQMQTGLEARLFVFASAMLYLWAGCLLAFSPSVDAFFERRGVVAAPSFPDGD